MYSVLVQFVIIARPIIDQSASLIAFRIKLNIGEVIFYYSKSTVLVFLIYGAISRSNLGAHSIMIVNDRKIGVRKSI